MSLFGDPDVTFAEFWARYPRKVSKGRARRAWATALTKASADVIMSALARHKFSADPKYIPYPTTWLNGESWTDVQEDLTADPWGLRAWYAAHDKVAPKDGSIFFAAGWECDAYEEILVAAGIDETWRGDLDTMGKWIVDGYRPDSIRDVIIEARSKNPAVPKRLEYLDRLVRMRAYHYDFVRHEWRRDR